jgi:glycosyltransferase involved in cell wall biosynthesis
MTISVVIPTYNRTDLLCERALPSVLHQSLAVDEVIIVADGMSGREMGKLGQRVKDIGDPRISIWNIPRQKYPEDLGTRWLVLGLDARNYGLDRAQGDWIAPLDDDDEWTFDHVAVLFYEAIKAGADFAYGMSEYHWPDGRPQLAGRYPPGMGSFCDGAQLYRNGMDYRYDMGCIERGLPEDGDLWTRMYEGGVKFTFVPQVVHHYYPNPR